MTVLPFCSGADVEQAMQLISRHLASGGLLAYPTETVYGLGSRPRVGDLQALNDLTARPQNKPFLLLVAGRQMVCDCGLRFNEAADRLADAFWPGPLTMVLGGGNPNLPDELRGPQGGIAVRWTSHPQTERMIRMLDMPISSTSANVSGKNTLEDVESILAEFRVAAAEGLLLALDAGRLPMAPSSTIVDCTSDDPRVLREGAVARSRIDETLRGACR